MRILVFLLGIIIIGSLTGSYHDKCTFTISEDFIKKCIDSASKEILKITIERNRYDNICLYRNPLCTTGEHFNTVWEKPEWIRMISCNLQGGCGAKPADISFKDSSCGWEASITNFSKDDYIVQYWSNAGIIIFEIGFL
jgi:hypothetical protein